MNRELEAAIQEWRNAHKHLQEITEIIRSTGDSQILDDAIEHYKSAKERLLVVALWDFEQSDEVTA